MSEHWCTYCQGVNAHNCQFNANVPRQRIYVTNTTAQPAQAVPLLSDAELQVIEDNHLEGGSMGDVYRAIEAAVRAKFGIVGKEGGNV